MDKVKVRSYDKEFKVNTVILYLSSGKSYEQIGKELGIPASTLVHWVHSYQRDGEGSFPGKGNLNPTEAEHAKLRKELAIIVAQVTAMIMRLWKVSSTH